MMRCIYRIDNPRITPLIPMVSIGRIGAI